MCRNPPRGRRHAPRGPAGVGCTIRTGLKYRCEFGSAADDVDGGRGRELDTLPDVPTMGRRPDILGMGERLERRILVLLFWFRFLVPRSFPPWRPALASWPP